MTVIANLLFQIIRLNKHYYETKGASLESMYTTAITASRYNYYKLQHKPSSPLHHLICLCVLLIHFTYMFWLTYNPAEKCLIQTPGLIKQLVRPLDSCSYCKGNYYLDNIQVTVAFCYLCVGLGHPKVFGNLTRKEFRKYAYTSHPMILKNAVSHWLARKVFGVQFFKRLYQKYENALAYNYYEGCNYFSYDSGIPTLESFFSKIDTLNSSAASWYVGW